jgi:DNA-binding MarR family transcriptional regulator
LNRPLNLLLERDLLTSKRSAEQHRSKLLRLTPQGQRVEARASEHERKVLRAAFDHVGKSGAAAWMTVMEVIADNN